jgi:hypothetical protein
MSQGSNAAGGGALTAFTGKSAAKAEPETIASAVANKAAFFMVIPITFPKNQSDSERPRGKRSSTETKLLTSVTIWSAAIIAESKKVKHLPTF